MFASSIQTVSPIIGESDVGKNFEVINVADFLGRVTGA